MPTGRPIAPKICAHCSNTFQARSNRARWCSLDCRLDGNIDRRGPNECWPWKGGKTEAGYGILSTKHGEDDYAHRAACRRKHGPPPSDRHYAIHSCDNPPCCNGEHLSWATPTANVEDMYAKGRQGQRNYATGDRHGRRKRAIQQEAL